LEPVGIYTSELLGQHNSALTAAAQQIPYRMTLSDSFIYYLTAYWLHAALNPQLHVLSLYSYC
jgi:hypothetical protein